MKTKLIDDLIEVAIKEEDHSLLSILHALRGARLADCEHIFLEHVLTGLVSMRKYVDEKIQSIKN